MNFLLINFIIALASTAFTTFSIGWFVFLKNPKSTVNKTFAFYSFSIAWWSFTQIWLIACDKRLTSLIWTRIEQVGVFFIPTFFIHFVISFLGIRGRKWLLRISYLFSFIFASLCPTRYMMADAVPKFYVKHFATPGFAYHFAITFFLILICYGLWELFKEYRKSTGVRRNQMKYLWWPSLFGYLGGSANFLLVYDISVPILNPFGTYCVAIYIMTVAYAIGRYKLMNIDLAVRGILSFLGYAFASLTIFIPILILARYNLVLTIIASVLIISLSPALFRLIPKYTRAGIDKIIYHGKFGYLERLNHLWENNKGEQYTSYQIATKLVDEVSDIMGLKSASFFLYDNYRNSFRPLAEAGSEGRIMTDVGIPFFTKQEVFIKHLLTSKKPVVREEFNPHNISMSQSLEKLEAEVVFPLFAESRLIGFFVLGSKANKEMFHHEDIDTLMRQIEIAQNHLSHTVFMEERASFSRKLAHDMKNLFGKNIDPIIHDLLEAKSDKQKEQTLEDLIAQLTFLNRCLKDNFDLVSVLERLVKQSYALAPGDIGKVISYCAELYKPTYEEKKLFIKLDIPENLPKALINEEDILKVFNNLLDNALKFTKKGGVSIKVEAKEKETLVKFSDTGLGIDEDELENIFEPKVKMPDEESHGSGLGLTIVKDIIEAHKGRIWVESKSDEGTIFYFTLPFSRQADKKAEA